MVTIQRHPVSYQKRLFAFIDILGVEEMVGQSKSDPTKITTLYDALGASRETLDAIRRVKLKVLDSDANQWIVHRFSDTTTISAPYYSHDDLVALASGVMLYQYELWYKLGLFVRGAIVYDDILDEPDTIFGPAIVHAYHLERHKAFWPRVLVDRRILDMLTVEERDRDLAEYLAYDTGDIAYLDYLKDLFQLFAFGELKEPKPRGIIHPLELVSRHKRQIHAQVSSIRCSGTEDKVGKLCKYVILAEHHNLVVESICRDAAHLILDNGLLWKICLDWATAGLAGEAYEIVYSARKVEYVNMLPIVALAYKKAVDELRTYDEFSFAVDEFAAELTRLIPKHLSSSLDSLRESKIDCAAILG
ncbi:hypothetical protein ACFLXV_03655 [Chloroflexota bacterium]